MAFRLGLPQYQPAGPHKTGRDGQLANFVVTEDGTTVVVGTNGLVTMNIPDGGSVVVEANPVGGLSKVLIRFGGDSKTDTAIVDLTTLSQDRLQMTSSTTTRQT
jgi:hypothetical protein